MIGVSFWAIIAAALAAFIVSTAWYIVFAEQRAKLSPAAKKAGSMKRPQAAKMLAEIVRNITLALVIAYLVNYLDVSGLKSSLHLGLLLWIGFPFVLLTGSIMWENTPWKLATLHAGDWLIKLLLMSAILGTW